MENIEKKEIIYDTETYFKNQKKNLDKRISEVKLNKEEEQEIIKSKTIKTIRDKVLGVFKIGDLINTILNWNEEIDSEIKETKKQYLLSVYFDKTDNTEESIKNIGEFLTNPQGNTIFNKILRVLDNNPPDFELTNNLANVLNHIINSDFKNLFEDHKFAINQIELMSPQSILLLSDRKNWPIWKLSSFSSTNGILTHNWIPDFMNIYARNKSINDRLTKERIGHSLNDLIKNRYAEAIILPNKENEKTGAIRLTKIGTFIFKYLEKK